MAGAGGKPHQSRPARIVYTKDDDMNTPENVII